MSSTNLKIVIVVASGLLLLGSSLATARQNGVAKTCAGQVEILCPEQAGRGRLQECIKSRQTELSGACRAEVELVVTIVGACADDRKKLCANAKSSGSGIRECMKSHMGDLGDVCKAALAKAETGNK
ncbi:hypothetical protein [Bradyrhizobium sp. McL0616]|uniref:hypothetical protein n=1 Tax=Bradyrhizobium sp. McL0616 TaxID=3415674 RepID=UPI003CF3C451